MNKLKLPLMVTHRGEGVLIFPAYEFAEKLAEFKSNNRGVVITAIAAIPLHGAGESTEIFHEIVVNCEMKWRYSLPA